MSIQKFAANDTHALRDNRNANNAREDESGDGSLRLVEATMLENEQDRSDDYDPYNSVGDRW